MLRNKLRQIVKVVITIDQVQQSLIYYNTYKPVPRYRLQQNGIEELHKTNSS